MIFFNKYFTKIRISEFIFSPYPGYYVTRKWESVISKNTNSCETPL